jgi:hypothetical protein
MFDTKLAAWLWDPQMNDQDYSFATLLSQYLNQTPIGHGMTLFASDLAYCIELARRLKCLIHQHNLTEALYQETRVPPILASTFSLFSIHLNFLFVFFLFILFF